MEKAPRAIIFLLLIVDFTVAQNATSKAGEFHVGVILDLGSLVGKLGRTSLGLAVEDFYAAHQNYSTRIVLHIRDSMGNDVQAASAAIELRKNYEVQAIIGPEKSSEAVFISKLGNISQVPTLSFTATSPSLTSEIMPYFVRATVNDSAQVNSIASLIRAYGWREVVLVYEDTDYGRGILPYLVDALQEVDAHVSYRSVIPLSATSENITQELYKLMTMQTRVFIVHMSPTMASLLFTKAKEVRMMNKGFAWIITNGVANIFNALNPTVIDAMNGVIGVRNHVPKSQELDKFSIRWNRMYQRDNPDESPFNKLSIVGLWGYDTLWALAQAAEKVGTSGVTNKIPQSSRNSTCLESMAISIYGPELLTAIVQSKFGGLSGDFDLTDRQLQVSVFQIINVIGENWREIGFWTAESGLSRKLNKNGLKLAGPASTSDLNPVIWPGESTEIPRGWEIPSSGKKLRVGVRTSIFSEFIKTIKDPVTNATRVSGLSIDLFEEAVNRLPFALAYEYLAFDTADIASTGSYDEFVYQVYLQCDVVLFNRISARKACLFLFESKSNINGMKYDIAVGDITIRYNRTLYVDFTIPHTEAGVAMIVPVKENMNRNMWIFLKPLSIEMWFGSIIFFMYTGVVVWLLEHLNGNEHVHGPFSLKQLGFTMFFAIFEEKEKLERFLSRMVLLVWMFVLVVLTSSYTANFASILTVQQLSPTVTDVHELQKQGEYVGFHRGSYIEGLLEDIGFDRSKIRAYDTPDDFNGALSSGSKNGGVAALVLEVPYIKLFLAKYSKTYTMVGPIYKSAGFAFALPKQSPILSDISRAILNITGGDCINQFEKKWIYQKSQQREDTIDGPGAITFGSFGGLFLLTGSVTTCSLLVAVMMNHNKIYRQNAGIKGDGQNQCEHGQQEQNEDSQGDQNTIEDGDGSDIENQTTLSVPHSCNTDGDQLPDSKEKELIDCGCTQNNKATQLSHIGSQIIHRGDKISRSSSGSQVYFVN